MKYLRTFENDDFAQEPISGKNEREVIQLFSYGRSFSDWGLNRKDARELYYEEEEVKGFEFIQKSIWDLDIESGYVQYRTILKRVSDGKYFEWTVEERVDDDHFFTECKEVFPYQKTVTDFE